MILCVTYSFNFDARYSQYSVNSNHVLVVSGLAESLRSDHGLFEFCTVSRCLIDSRKYFCGLVFFSVYRSGTCGIIM